MPTDTLLALLTYWQALGYSGPALAQLLDRR